MAANAERFRFRLGDVWSSTARKHGYGSIVRVPGARFAIDVGFAAGYHWEQPARSGCPMFASILS